MKTVSVLSTKVELGSNMEASISRAKNLVTVFTWNANVLTKERRVHLRGRKTSYGKHVSSMPLRMSLALCHWPYFPVCAFFFLPPMRWKHSLSVWLVLIDCLRPFAPIQGQSIPFCLHFFVLSLKGVCKSPAWGGIPWMVISSFTCIWISYLREKNKSILSRSSS